jgi:hypothetical protein
LAFLCVLAVLLAVLSARSPVGKHICADSASGATFAAGTGDPLTGVVAGPAPFAGPGPNGTLKGTVSPADAFLVIDGRPLPTSGGSFSTSLPPGPHFLDANAINYQTQTRQFDIQPGQVVWENITLVMENGWINGTVSPSSAAVTINGKLVHPGHAGTINESVPPGGYYVNASLAGYETFNDYVLVLGGATTFENISLSPPSASTFFTLPVIGALVAVGVGAVASVLWVMRREKGGRASGTGQKPQESSQSDSDRRKSTKSSRPGTRGRR